MRVDIQDVHYGTNIINKIYYGSNLVFDRSLYNANQNVYTFDLSKVSGNYKLALQNANSNTITDWGDGTVDTKLFHYYTSQGTYTVKTRQKINGDYNDINTAKSLISCTNIDNTVTDYNYMFSDCANLKTVPASIANGVTDTYGMFYGCTSLVTAPSIPSTIINCYTMFQDCVNLTTIPQANVTLMQAVKNGTNTTCINYSSCYGGCTKITSPQSYATLSGVYPNWF